MARFLVVLALVLGSACQPQVAERCCQAMFPNRPQVSDILAGYAGRRVYDQNDLIIALGDTSVRRIVIAGDITLTQSIRLVPFMRGKEITATGRARVFISDSVASAFVVDFTDDPLGVAGFAFIGLDVYGASADTYADTFLTVENESVRGIVVERVRFQGDTLISGRPLNLNVSQIVDNYVDWSEGGRTTWKLDIDCTGCIISGNTFTQDASGAGQNAVRGTMVNTAINGNAFGNGALDLLNGAGCSVSANAEMFSVTTTGSGHAIVGNTMKSGGVTTSGGSGSNAIVGNANAGTITAHASDQATGNT